MNYPKEAWYDGYKAKQVYEDVYFVWRGAYSDPAYVMASKVINVSIFGAHIEGKEADYYDVWGFFEENYEPTKQEIAEAVYDSIDCAEGKL